jgi:nickel transport protein
MRAVIALLVTGIFLVGTSVGAHELRHTITRSDAVIIELFYADSTPFDFHQYEVYRDGEDLPFQVGQTDALGRVVFVPDQEGTWRLRAFSEDGHGADFTFETDAETDAGGAAVQSDQPLIRRYTMIFVGVGIILGAFGVFSLFLKRRMT